MTRCLPYCFSIALLLFAASTSATYGQTLEGMFEDRGKNGIVFHPLDGTSELQVANPDKISKGLVNLPTKVTGVVTSQKQISIEKTSNELLEQWQATKQDFVPKHSTILEKRFAAIQKVFSAALTQEKDPKLRIEYSKQLDETIDALCLINTTETEGTSDKLQVLRLARIALNQEKSLYRVDYGFYPAAYAAMVERSQGSVSIWDKRNNYCFCSGALIGQDWILSCKHCTGDLEAKDLEVQFNYEMNLKREPVTPVRFNGAQILFQNQPLDFVVFQLEKGDDGKKAGERYPIQILSRDRASLMEPIYVVGYPEGKPKMIADGAHVLFPYEASEKEYRKELTWLEIQYENDPDKSKIRQQFIDSYRKTDLGTYLNYSTRWWDKPTIGADCNTFHSSSGSPVYSKMSHRIVGLLFAGEADRDEIYQAGWRYHEAILPATLIMEQLIKSPAAKEHGVSDQ